MLECITKVEILVKVVASTVYHLGLKHMMSVGGPWASMGI